MNMNACTSHLYAPISSIQQHPNRAIISIHNLHNFYQKPMGLQVTLPKTKYSNTNQISWRSSALVQNVKQIKAHPNGSNIQLQIPVDIIGLDQNVILLPLVDFATQKLLAWVGTSKVCLAVTKPPAGDLLLVPWCKKVGGSFKLKKGLKSLNLKNLCLGRLESTKITFD